MAAKVRHSLPALAFLFILIAPVSGTFSLQSVAIHPSVEALKPAEAMTIRATAQIIPQGPTTYIEGYTMVLSTELDPVKWDVAVLVDGNRAAVFEKTGSTVFINGYLLSYPTTRDVALEISVDGYSPKGTAETGFIAIRITELNNQGRPVSGSDQTVYGKLPPLPPESLPEVTTTVETIYPVTTKAGIGSVVTLGGLFLGIFLTREVKPPS